jgi:hypothetical protein
VATAVETPALNYYLIRTIKTDGTAVARIQTEEQVLDVPSLLGRRLRPGDRIVQLGPDGFVVEVRGAKLRWLHAPIGYAAQPKQNKNGEWMVRVETANCASGLRNVIIAGDALRRYFYQTGESQNLYEILGCSSGSTLDTLQIAWRVKKLELSSLPAASKAIAVAERAFNLLAHPDLRKCCDALLKDEDVPPIFPYGGFGLILSREISRRMALRSSRTPFLLSSQT